MDISYIWTCEGWLYLAVVIDLFARRVVGWATADRLHRNLALAALRKAITMRQPNKGLIHHSDRGSQYFSIDYKAELKQHGITISMSAKGNCYDNAMVEACPMIPRIIGCGALQNPEIRAGMAHQLPNTCRGLPCYCSIHRWLLQSCSTTFRVGVPQPNPV